MVTLLPICLMVDFPEMAMREITTVCILTDGADSLHAWTLENFVSLGQTPGIRNYYV